MIIGCVFLKDFSASSMINWRETGLEKKDQRRGCYTHGKRRVAGTRLLTK